MAGTPILIVVGGLPATGKSTVASALVRRTGFAFVRVDRIEQAIIGSGERSQLFSARPARARGSSDRQIAHFQIFVRHQNPYQGSGVAR